MQALIETEIAIICEELYHGYEQASFAGMKAFVMFAFFFLSIVKCSVKNSFMFMDGANAFVAVCLIVPADLRFNFTSTTSPLLISIYFCCSGNQNEFGISSSPLGLDLA